MIAVSTTFHFRGKEVTVNGTWWPPEPENGKGETWDFTSVTIGQESFDPLFFDGDVWDCMVEGMEAAEENEHALALEEHAEALADALNCCS